jgi:flavin reductase (DIM6/NTAB) family NADH-FMN oxidoreductase RutF
MIDGSTVLHAAPLREAMRRTAGTVFVVAAGPEGQRCGLTATSVVSLSLDPPALLVCIHRRSSTYAAITAQRRFSVNLLRASQVTCAQAFSSASTTGEQRFSHGRWRTSADGVPWLEGAHAAMLCDLEEVIAYGSHMAVVGRVATVHLGCDSDAAPLLYSDGTYRALLPRRS